MKENKTKLNRTNQNETEKEIKENLINRERKKNKTERRKKP